MLLISELILHLHFTTPAKLPYWMGSAFRGVFGSQIRKLLCTNLQRDCESCRTKESCLYYYMYEREVAKRGYAPPQRPIILIPPFFGKEMYFEKDGKLDVELLFFGDFRKYLPHAFLGLSLSGHEGLGAERHYGINKFEIISATCNFSKVQVYDGKTINLANLTTTDIDSIKPIDTDEITIGFKTPFTGRVFPPRPNEFLSLVRNRLIRFVNEYGDQKKIEQVKAKGKIKNFSKHFHSLQRRSTRGDKKVFKGYTGIVEYTFEDLSDVGKWLLSVALVTGLGPDSSFGCGFIQKM